MPEKKRRVSLTVSEVEYAALLKLAHAAGEGTTSPRFKTVSHFIWCMVFDRLADEGYGVDVLDSLKDTAVRKELLAWLHEHEVGRHA